MPNYLLKAERYFEGTSRLSIQDRKINQATQQLESRWHAEPYVFFTVYIYSSTADMPHLFSVQPGFPGPSEATRGWRKLRNKEPDNLHISSIIIRMREPQSMRWAGTCHARGK